MLISPEDAAVRLGRTVEEINSAYQAAGWLPPEVIDASGYEYLLDQFGEPDSADLSEPALIEGGVIVRCQTGILPEDPLANLRDEIISKAATTPGVSATYLRSVLESAAREVA